MEKVSTQLQDVHLLEDVRNLQITYSRLRSGGETCLSRTLVVGLGCTVLLETA